ncbi:Detoxification-like protein [Thalictrum thalictroides]|uniref:Detoxification-like protein n=1 Tax=Thalictrum thalictroides TaxID=46969 RepID=A0A7J6UX34_THATH|nr:Detoxification-like protein [Thalictrum thalictroides]
MENKNTKGEETIPLLLQNSEFKEDDDDVNQDLVTRVWIESKKLWHIVGPSIFSRVAGYSMFIITQAFAGHMGDLELASISIANTVILGFNFGLLLGMASALETLCGQAFGAKKYNMMGVYMQQQSGLAAIWMIPLHFSFAFQLPLQRFLQSQLKTGVIAWVSLLP